MSLKELNQKHEELLAKREALLQVHAAEIDGQTRLPDQRNQRQNKLIANQRNLKLLKDVEEISARLKQRSRNAADKNLSELTEEYMNRVEREYQLWLDSPKSKDYDGET